MGKDPNGRWSLRSLVNKAASVAVSVAMATSLTPLPAYAEAGDSDAVDLGIGAIADALLQVQSADRNNPSTLYLNTSAEVAIDEGESAYFTFTAPDAGYYTFYSYDNGGDPKGWLYSDANFENSIQSNDDEEDSNNFRITRRLDANQRIYLRAGAYDDGSATYKVTVMWGGAADDPDNSDNPDDPDPIPVSSTFNTPIAIGQSIQVPAAHYPAATFEFTAPETGFYTFKITDANSVRAWASDSEGYYGSSRSISPDATGAINITYGVEKGEKAYLHVDGTNGKDPYAVSVSAADEHLVSLTVGAASSRVTGSSVQHYSFTAEKAGSYNFTADGQAVEAWFGDELTYGEGSAAESITLDADGFQQSLHEGETVYLRTKGAADGSYTVKVADESVAVTALALDAESARITTEGERFFEFEAPEDGLYQFTATKTQGSIPRCASTGI